MGMSSSGVGKVYLDNVAFMDDNGDLLTKDTTTKLLKVGGEGQSLKVSGGILTYYTPTTASFTYLKETTLTAAGTNILVDGLNLSSDGGIYFVEINAIPSNNSTIRIELNKDTTTSNYCANYITAAGTTLAAVNNTNSNTISPQLLSGRSLRLTGYIVSSNGVPAFYYNGGHDINAAAGQTLLMGGIKAESAANLTAINLKGSVNWEIGSYIKIYKMNA